MRLRGNACNPGSHPDQLNFHYSIGRSGSERSPRTIWLCSEVGYHEFQPKRIQNPTLQSDSEILIVVFCNHIGQPT